MREKFEKYISGKLGLTTLSNLRKLELHSQMGEYLYQECNKINFDKDKHINLRYLIEDYNDGFNDFRRFGFFFTSDLLKEEILETIYGEPIRHSEYGEGWAEYDEETDDCIYPRDYENIAYFIDIADYTIHICNDDRGTSVEVSKDIDTSLLLPFFIDLIDQYIKIIKI